MELPLTIYAQFLIALISFVGPIMVYLLSIFQEGTSRIKKRFEEQKKQIQILIKRQLEQDDADIEEIIKKSNTDLTLKLEIANKGINRHEPKLQIKLLFIPLLCSLFFVFADCLVRSNYFNLYNHFLSIGCLLLSSSLLLFALYTLRQITWTIISTKKDVDIKDSTSVIPAN